MNNLINQARPEFGDLTQIKFLEGIGEPEFVADDRSRNNAAYKNMSREPKRQMNLEDTRWTCPRCGYQNYARVATTAGTLWHIERYWRDEDPDEDEPEVIFQPIITPRIFICHHNSCGMRRFYRREGTKLYARFVGKYEDVDELAFTSEQDPLKFYKHLTRPASSSGQIKLFNEPLGT